MSLAITEKTTHTCGHTHAVGQAHAVNEKSIETESADAVVEIQQGAQPDPMLPGGVLVESVSPARQHRAGSIGR